MALQPWFGLNPDIVVILAVGVLCYTHELLMVHTQAGGGFGRDSGEPRFQCHLGLCMPRLGPFGGWWALGGSG